MLRKGFLQVLALAGLMLLFPALDRAQTAGPHAVIKQAIDENRRVILPGNTRPEAIRQNDLGPVADDLHLDMYLQLKRSPEQDLAAAEFVESLTDKASPNFHRWITAEEYGQRFGAAPEDIATVSRWLESHGFTVNGVPANNMVIDFSGTAGQVREALHTEIHNLEVKGERHFANMSDPQIPAALLPAVTGVVSLNNFRPHPTSVPKSQYTVTSTEHLIVPGDLATIYGLNAAFGAGYTGRGQTIVVVEDTDLYNYPGDWNTFRSTFGLTAYSYGSLTQVHPAPGSGVACVDPGVNGDDSEAAIDVEWASAAAPNAAIVMAACEDTTNWGELIALQNLLTNGSALPGVVSISYGAPEVEMGASFNSYVNTLLQTAAAVGVSVFVSSGDADAAASDRDMPYAIHGIGISGLASTVYAVAVGGTDFYDSATNTASTYWNSTNGTYYNSAKSYIPEIPWNDSCGSQVLATYLGYSTTYGYSGLCNGWGPFDGAVGGSGGPSACATGYPTANSAVSGTCAGYAKPSWQSIYGNPSDGVRDIPDVSLFASNGWWGHYYLVCYSDGVYGGASCSNAPYYWAGFGGTSVSSPIMAGIQALINQALGASRVGNPNPVYYAIAANEYSTAAGRTACNSTTDSGSACVFNDITTGDIDVPCAGAFNCYLDGQALGVLSTSNSSYAPAYGTNPGWDFATGIGSVNANNLLNAFASYTAPSVHIDSPASGAVLSGTVTVSGWALDNIMMVGTAITAVHVFVDGLFVGTATYGSSRPDVCSAYPGRPGCPNVGFTYSLNTAGLTTGSHTITVTANDSGSPLDYGSASVTVTVAVIPSVSIDTPASGATISGTVSVSGWAIDNISTIGTAISSVHVLVDGVPMGTATYGTPRPDVCSVYPGRPGCPNVGYTYSLNTAGLSAGSHVITVTATDSASPPDTGSASVTVTVSTAVIPSVHIDAPASGSTISGTISVSGWAIDNISVVGTAISGVQVLVDGTVAGSAIYGISRPDVCSAYPGRPGCPYVGFTYALNTSSLASGSHTITVMAEDSASPPDTGSASVTVQK